MPLELVTLPCLADNYAYLIHDPATGATGVVDVPDAAPVLAELSRREWALSDIFLTHHHDDHIAGVKALRAATGAKVWGAAADRHRLPPLDVALVEGDAVAFGPEVGVVIDVSGHTLGHIAYVFADSGLAFTGDSLMAAGCGRLFEGSPDQMWAAVGGSLRAAPIRCGPRCKSWPPCPTRRKFARAMNTPRPTCALPLRWNRPIPRLPRAPCG
ncbi:MAG: hypothetical protein RI979_1902 [Pseudomonadota bacterium]